MSSPRRYPASRMRGPRRDPPGRSRRLPGRRVRRRREAHGPAAGPRRRPADRGRPGGGRGCRGADRGGWALSTGLLLVLNEKRKRDARAALETAKADARDVVATQDGAPFVGSGGRLEPEERLTDAPSRIDTLEAALRSAGVIKGA